MQDFYSQDREHIIFNEPIQQVLKLWPCEIQLDNPTVILNIQMDFVSSSQPMYLEGYTEGQSSTFIM